MASITIDGYGSLNVPDGFRDWSPEKQQALIAEATRNRTPTKTPSPSTVATDAEAADSDWIGQTIGGTGGAVGGALTGAAIGTPIAGPVGTVVGGVLGGIAGGFFGGGTGELIEQSLDNALDGDEKTKWNSLSIPQKDEVLNAAIEEGAFGAIPGGASLLAKGTRILHAGKKGLLGNIMSSIVGTLFGGTAGRAVSKAVSWAPVEKLFGLTSKLSAKQQEKLYKPLLHKYFLSLPKGGFRKNTELNNLIMNVRPDLKPKVLVEHLLKTESGKKVLRNWAIADVTKVAFAGALGGELAGSMFKEIADSLNKELGTGGESNRYAEGGKVSLGDKIGILRKEGYPQKQAVAIAYSMKKRGEL